jgi:hypothetical protein
MTMKGSVRCGALVVVTAVSAAMAGGPVEDESGGLALAGKAPTVKYVLASPRMRILATEYSCWLFGGGFLGGPQPT